MCASLVQATSMLSIKQITLGYSMGGGGTWAFTQHFTAHVKSMDIEVGQVIARHSISVSFRVPNHVTARRSSVHMENCILIQGQERSRRALTATEVMSFAHSRSFGSCCGESAQPNKQCYTSKRSLRSSDRNKQYRPPVAYYYRGYKIHTMLLQLSDKTRRVLEFTHHQRVVK